MTTDKKRVYTLYRVSTAGQVEKDDIPMQRTDCREFAERQGWEIVKEFSEKGISGFKVSAKDRDAIQEIQKDAALGKFDILLVFMFDRIGRREDETPFVVEWFVKNGIEVWSAHEGQQRFDNHVDKLMNYIRYWQASGESIKTSIRTKTRLGQIVQEGRFRGGTAPFGYKLERGERVNKKGHPLYEITVDQQEAAIVQQIFDLYINHGYGSHRISKYLSEHRIMNRSGNNFTNTTIQHMLSNNAYLGILKSGESQSEIFPDLQIIDQTTFELAQQSILKRSADFKENKRHNTKGNSLLQGNVFCGHCGARLILTTNGKKYERKTDGVVIDTPKYRYVCYNKTRHPHLCDGQTGYTTRKLDAIIEQIIRGLFERITDNPKEELIENRYAEILTERQANLDRAREELKARSAELAEYEAEVLNVIRGTSAFSKDLISKMYADAEQRTTSAKNHVAQCEDDLLNSKRLLDEFCREYDNLMTWAEMFEDSPMDTKKVITGHLISTVKVSRDYNVDIELSVSCEQFAQSMGS